MSSEFGDLNAVGEVRIVGRMGSFGGNDGRGPIDNVLPTGNLTDGPEWSSRAGDMINKGVRAGMSTARNMSIKRDRKSMGASR